MCRRQNISKRNIRVSSSDNEKAKAKTCFDNLMALKYNSHSDWVNLLLYIAQLQSISNP